MRHCFHLRPGAASETLEGIRALVVDKDHAPRWNPARIDDVTPEMVEAFFRRRGRRTRIRCGRSTEGARREQLAVHRLRQLQQFGAVETAGQRVAEALVHPVEAGRAFCW